MESQCRLRLVHAMNGALMTRRHTHQFLVHVIEGLAALLRGRSFQIAAAFVLAGSAVSIKWDMGWPDAGVLVLAIAVVLGPDARDAASLVLAGPMAESQRALRSASDLMIIAALVGCLGAMVLALIMFLPRAIAAL
jgi:hypothetical protein